MTELFLSQERFDEVRCSFAIGLIISSGVPNKLKSLNVNFEKRHFNFKIARKRLSLRKGLSR